MRDTENSNGETLKAPARVASDTRKLRTVRIAITVFAVLAGVVVAVVAAQFALAQMG